MTKREDRGSETILFTDLRHIFVGDLRWHSEDGQVMPVAGPPEPQVDAYADLSMVPRGIEFAAQPGKKLYDAEITGPMGPRAIHDGGIYRSWSLHVAYPPGRNFGSYSTDAPESVAVVYAESTDGFAWTERARCTLHVPGQTSFDGATFFMDPNGPAEQRYKAVYMAQAPKSEAGPLWAEYAKLHPRYRDARLTEDNVRCMYAAVSGDGVNWQAVREPLMVHYSDTDTTVRYDAWLDRYVMYTRLYPHRRRAIGWAESEDFHHWTPVQPLIWLGLDGALTDDVYLNAYSGYPGLPEYHLMFPMIYDRYTQRSCIQLYTSDNGLQWNRVPGGPVVEPGESGDWDSTFIHVGKDLLPLGPERIAVPYHGTRYPHKYPRWKEVLKAGRRSWVCWPRGRLCALKAGLEGEFWTNPLKPAGRKIRLNVRTRRAGEVRVEVVGVSGRSIADCDPVVGDSLSMPIHWQGQAHVGAPPDAPVRLHFKLRAAELFGFEWV